MGKAAKQQELQTIKTPNGETLIVLPFDDYLALINRVDIAEAKATAKAVAKGEIEVLSNAETKELLAAKTPLAFWRAKRGLTQQALAEAAEISQNYLSGLEGGTRKGDPALFKRLAAALNVRMEDLVED